MDYEEEINALHAETLAMSIIIGQILSKLATNPLLRPSIVEGFNQAAEVADSVAIRFGKSASPEHTVKTIRIIEEIRTAVLGNEGKQPRHQV
ncbi:hypothetical protein [Bradyrhizobium sp. sBnM-33]|uniref:hypothetical protein n=1 Tax=Bradyrhizobium sp. sBnM-33 TaxID=2831780 RepID=UPI001BCC3E4D|nr:hypothetical protein [Bradyrhizobium sp. sBnM-33]WOH53209.1 hypothetical protein RX328_14625 [Bradyrhizobium sp. sBnM-33]